MPLSLLRLRAWQIFLTVIAATAACLLLRLNASAHMNLVSLDQFVKSPQKIHYLLTEETSVAMPYLESFEMGEGKRVFILTDELPPQSFASTLHPGELLVFAESQSWIEGRPLIRNASGHRGLYVMNPEQHRALLMDSRNFVHAVNVQQKSTLRFPHQEAFFSDLTFNIVPGMSTPISDQNLLLELMILSGEIEFEISGKEGQSYRIAERGSASGRELTRRYLISRFRDHGLQVRDWCYAVGWSRGCNVVAQTQPESGLPTLVFSSHLDSVQNAGADDNASGTAALLELAKHLAQEPELLKINIAFIAFDQEELGLIGSRELASKIETELNISYLAAVNMDMIAFDGDNDESLHIMDCGREDSRFLKRAAEAAIRSLSLGLNPVDACTNRSDHASFWKSGLPALMLSENFFGGDSNGCYHRKCDKIKEINLSYYTKIVSLSYGLAHIISNAL